MEQITHYSSDKAWSLGWSRGMCAKNVKMLPRLGSLPSPSQTENSKLILEPKALLLHITAFTA